MIASKYRLFLLSNTDHTHIEKFEHKEGQTFARDFIVVLKKFIFHTKSDFANPMKMRLNTINNHNLNPKKHYLSTTKRKIQIWLKIRFSSLEHSTRIDDVVELLIKNNLITPVIYLLLSIFLMLSFCYY